MSAVRLVELTNHTKDTDLWAEPWLFLPISYLVNPTSTFRSFVSYHLPLSHHICMDYLTIHITPTIPSAAPHPQTLIIPHYTILTIPYPCRPLRTPAALRLSGTAELPPSAMKNSAR